jgi:hypothetical protein
MLVERAGAIRWQPPESRAKILALGSLKEIRIWDFHYVGRTPVEVVWRNQKVTFYRSHCSFFV